MPALDALPRKIGPYRVLKKLGEGGMGVVYLAEDQHKQKVALKVLGAAVAGDPSARRRLAREVETMQRVRNRFVAEIITADTDGPAPYIVTRYVEGRTLEETVRQEGPLRGQALDALAEGLAEALTAIHAAGVVHRDLKPGNVMLDNGWPVLIDFGIAHVQNSTRLTKTGLVMGTPGYLAPEVIEGQAASGASDVHSWGATVAFAATGRQPFGTGNYQTIFFRVIEGKAELGGVPERLLPFVAAALSTDPESRPTPRQLAAHLGMPGGAQLLLTGLSATRADAPRTRLDSPLTRTDPPAPRYQKRVMPPSPPGPLGPPPARVAYRSPAEAAADVADLLPPVAAPAAPQRQHAQAPSVVMPAVPRQPEWHPPGLGLIGLAAGVAAIALSVLLPVAGTAISLALITLLRAVDRGQSALSERRTLHNGAQPGDIVLVILAAPWTVVRAALTTVFLLPVVLVPALVAAGASVVFAQMNTLPEAGSWAAGAAVACYCFGPGSRGPKRQLRRISASVIRSRGALIVALISSWALALAIVSPALDQPPVLWPTTASMFPHLTGLPSLGGVLHSLQRLLLHETRGMRMLHLP